MASSLATLVMSSVQILVQSKAHAQSLSHYMLISMMGQQGFYPLEQFVRQTPEFSIDFQNLQFKHPLLSGLFGRIHRWIYFFSDETLNKLKNDLTEASKKGSNPETKKMLTLRGSLQFVSLNVYLDFVDYLKGLQ